MSQPVSAITERPYRALRRRRLTPVGLITEVDLPSISLIGARKPRHRQLFAALRQRGFVVEVAESAGMARGDVAVFCDLPATVSAARLSIEAVFELTPGDWSIVAGRGYSS